VYNKVIRLVIARSPESLQGDEAIPKVGQLILRWLNTTRGGR